jgi:hypothetical protein
MLLYTVMTQDGAEQRDVIAELVRIHTAAMNVPADFVHSIFPTYPRNQAHVAANHSPVASILGVMRGIRHSSFKPFGKCSRTTQGFPIAISQSRSKKCRRAKPWRMGDHAGCWA